MITMLMRFNCDLDCQFSLIKLIPNSCLGGFWSLYLILTLIVHLIDSFGLQSSYRNWKCHFNLCDICLVYVHFVCHDLMINHPLMFHDPFLYELALPFNMFHSISSHTNPTYLCIYMTIEIPLDPRYYPLTIHVPCIVWGHCATWLF